MYLSDVIVEHVMMTDGDRPDIRNEADERRFYLEDDEIELLESYRSGGPDERALLLQIARWGAPFTAIFLDASRRGAFTPPD